MQVRVGFKYVLCKDVFCFHKSGGTLKNQIDQNIKVASDQFKRKHGIEAWKNDVIFDEHIVKFLIQNCSDLSKINILSINVGIGDSLLQLKKLLREAGKEVALYHIVTQPNFLHDI